MNHWLTVVPNTENNTVLGRDDLQHVLQCKTGGLIGARHDDYRDNLGSVVSQVFSPLAIHNGPIISKGPDSKKKGGNSKTMHAKTGKEKEGKDVHVTKRKDKDNDSSLYGDLLIWHLWKRQTNTIIGICITDTDAKSYISKPLQSVLAAQEKGKKVLVEGILGHEASMVLKQLSSKLAT
eukprot:780060-Ditylum_brightwellii.AAC.1